MFRRSEEHLRRHQEFSQYSGSGYIVLIRIVYFPECLVVYAVKSFLEDYEANA